MEITQLGWRGYKIICTDPTHYIVRSPEGYIRYELPKKLNTTQDCIDTINKDIEITASFK